jgi:hypothetical protein
MQPPTHTEQLPEDDSRPVSAPRFDALGNPIPSKVCTSCHAELPLSAFRKDRAQLDGLQHNCTPCRKRSDRRYTQKKAAATTAIGPLTDALAAIPPVQLEALGQVLIELAQSVRGVQ